MFRSYEFDDAKWDYPSSTQDKDHILDEMERVKWEAVYPLSKEQKEILFMKERTDEQDELFEDIWESFTKLERCALLEDYESFVDLYLGELVH